MDAEQIINERETALSRATSTDRAEIAKIVKEREDALQWGFKQIAFAALSETSDWAEALEIGRQRMERKVEARTKFCNELEANNPGSKLSNEFADYAEKEKEIMQMYARFAEIYANTFKPLGAMLHKARCEVAERVIAEYPKSKDASDLAKHLQGNTPRGWLGRL